MKITALTDGKKSPTIHHIFFCAIFSEVQLRRERPSTSALERGSCQRFLIITSVDSVSAYQHSLKAIYLHWP